jgi:hypothetical protein
MDFKVGQVFENHRIRKTITRTDSNSIYVIEEWISKEPHPSNVKYMTGGFLEVLKSHNYKEIPQKSSNFKQIYDILNNEM